MSRRISDERLQELHEIVHIQVRPILQNNSNRVKRGKKARVPIVSVNGQELLRLIDELKQRRKTSDLTGPLTKQLKEMKVGDVIVIPLTTQGRITQARKTARKQMGNFDARWQSRTLPDRRIQITRVPDGTPHVYGRPTNPIIQRMIDMKVGQRIIVKGTAYRSLKTLARVKGNMPYADWRFEALISGNMRIIRKK